MIKIIQLITAEMIIADYNEETHEVENPLFIHQ